MSVVCAIKENGKVYIGSDSQCTSRGSRTSLSNPNNYKIWKYDGVDNCMFAHVGAVREGQIIKVEDDLVDDLDVLYDRINFKFVIKNLIPRIATALERYSCKKPEENGMDSSLFFAYNDKLYAINNDFCVLDIDDYCAIGSGSPEAKGSLMSTVGEDPEIRIIKAIKASAANDIYVDYPIILTNTEDCTFKVIFEDDLKNIMKGNDNK